MKWPNTFGKEISKQRELQRCKTAVKLYLDALRPSTNGQDEQDTEDLVSGLASHGSEGLRLGGPGSIHMKLKYSRGAFSISPGDAPRNMFEEWERALAEKFKAAGLQFRYYQGRFEP
ncbi:MAG: hypothetical protein WB760_03600 [Xanthobacteraceae bacterium]